MVNNDKSTLTAMANKSVTKYIVMTIFGIVAFTIGIVLIVLSAAGIDQATKKFISNGYLILALSGILLVAGPGTALMGVGVPCWIALGIQIQIARNKLKKSKNK